MTVTIPLQAFIEEQEIRGLTYHSPTGPIPGYQWRLLLRFVPTAAEAEKIEWTPWVFGSNQTVEEMLRQWQSFLSTHGHLAKERPPGTSAH